MKTYEGVEVKFYAKAVAPLWNESLVITEKVAGWGPELVLTWLKRGTEILFNLVHVSCMMFY
jgi:hypothetical protein